MVFKRDGGLRSIIQNMESKLFNRILVVVDSSKEREEFLDYVTTLFPESFYYLMTVIDSSKFIGRASHLYEEYVTELAKSTMERNESVLQKKGVSYDTRIELGRVSTKIFEVVESENINLLVIGSHSAAGTTRFKLGGIAKDILIDSNIPVLIMNSLVAPVLYPRILNPTSGSLYSYQASLVALSLAKELNGTLTCLYLKSDEERKDYEEKMRAEAEKKGVVLKCKVAKGSAVENILDELKDYDIIVGSRGYKGIKYSFRHIIKDFALDSLVRDTISLGQKPVLLICD